MDPPRSALRRDDSWPGDDPLSPASNGSFDGSDGGVRLSSETAENSPSSARDPPFVETVETSSSSAGVELSEPNLNLLQSTPLGSTIDAVTSPEDSFSEVPNASSELRPTTTSSPSFSHPDSSSRVPSDWSSDFYGSESLGEVVAIIPGVFGLSGEIFRRLLDDSWDQRSPAPLSGVPSLTSGETASRSSSVLSMAEGSRAVVIQYMERLTLNREDDPEDEPFPEEESSVEEELIFINGRFFEAESPFDDEPFFEEEESVADDDDATTDYDCDSVS